MRTFTNETTISDISRLVYSGTPSTGTLTTVYQNLTGYLRPLSEELAAINGVQWGQGFTLITETDSPILVGDVLTINSETYTVRGLANHNRGKGTAYFKYLLVKAAKA